MLGNIECYVGHLLQDVEVTGLLLISSKKVKLSQALLSNQKYCASINLAASLSCCDRHFALVYLAVPLHLSLFVPFCLFPGVLSVSPNHPSSIYLFVYSLWSAVEKFRRCFFAQQMNNSIVHDGADQVLRNFASILPLNTKKLPVASKDKNGAGDVEHMTAQSFFKANTVACSYRQTSPISC